MSSGTELSRGELEEHANIVRARLAETVQTIVKRGREFASPRIQLARNATKIAFVGAAIGVVLIGTVVGSIVASRRRAHRIPSERVAAIARWWRHPERVATQRKQPMLVEILRNAIVGGVSFVAVQMMKRASAKMLLPSASMRQGQ